MKMVKSLLLGSAAGLVAVAGAQAADLPVKAKAADPVRICSLYGKGFYYIPGSDMCLSITGFTRFQIYAFQGGMGTAPAGIAGAAAQGYAAYSNTNGPFNAPNGVDVRAGAQNDLTYRTRVMATFDARSQTAYGTLRSVITTGFTNDLVVGGTAGTTIYANRGFIQIAGFTMGKAVSFYDFYSSPAYSYYGLPTSDTGDGGQAVFAYTAQFGGGVSATISAEEPRRTSIQGTAAGTANLITSAAGYNQYVQYRYPDIVGAIRFDQAWGAFQVMGALHDASGGYYGNNATGQQNNGHPGDKWGFVMGVGLKFNLPTGVFDSQFNYTEGALRYLNQGISGGGFQLASQNVGFGNLTDGVYGSAGAGGNTVANGAPGTNTGINLTTAWGVNAAYDHRWSPALKTSIYGGYQSISYNNEANALLCAASFTNAGVSTTTGCNMNWKAWYIGSRTQWDVARSFYVGVDVLYSKLQSASGGSSTTSTSFVPVAAGPRPSGAYAIQDQEAWTFTFRAHRDIVP